MTYVKICGISDAATAKVALAHGADYLGFVFAGGRHQVEPEQVRSILAELPVGTPSVGVFMNQSPNVVAETALQSGITHIQLHGDECPSDYSHIGLPMIKAIPVTLDGCVLETSLTSSDFGLLDTRISGKTGGTGTPFNWHAARSQVPALPCFLAGGLNPGNVREAIETLAPYGVDVSSGVETSGVKDPEKIRQFIHEIRR